MSGLFSQWQSRYSAHGVATFPVDLGTKRPAVRGYFGLGLSASKQLADGRFKEADAFGFACGPGSRLTVLDVDTRDERVLADALDRHGKTPLIVRTGSGHFHGYFSNDNEPRAIRPFGNLPIDQLGSGYVIAPPSRSSKGAYEIIQGSLDEIDRLPEMRNAFRRPASLIEGNGKRNTALFDHCLEGARHSDSLDNLLDVARTFNDQAFGEPLDDNEVVKTARSAWGYEERDENFKKGGMAIISCKTALALAHDPYLSTLLTVLKGLNGPDAKFMVADGFLDTLKWPRRELPRARKRAIELRWIVQVEKPKPGRSGKPGKPALYVWGPARLNPSSL